MSTNLKSRGPVKLTRFCGPVREDGGPRAKLQLTLQTAFMQLTREDVVALRNDLSDYLEDMLDEDFDR